MPGDNACPLVARPPLTARQSRGHSTQDASLYRPQLHQCQVQHCLQGCCADASAQTAALEARATGGAGSNVPGGHQGGPGQAVSQRELPADLQQLLRACNVRLALLREWPVPTGTSSASRQPPQCAAASIATHPRCLDHLPPATAGSAAQPMPASSRREAAGAG